MRRKSNVAFGPGAASLILIVVILSMSVLGMLALMNARNDARLSDRATAVIAAGYALNDTAERKLAELDGVLARCEAVSATDEEYIAAVRGNQPEGMLLDGRTVEWTLTDGLRTLSCAVEVLPLGEGERFEWREHKLTAVTEEIDLWN